jgi:hypothetical protein
MSGPDRPALQHHKGFSIMFTHRHLLRSTVSLAVLAACFIATSASAGPLGAAGAIGGGLNGGVGPRHLDAAGQAGVHGGATLPRGDKAHETAGAATGAALGKAGEAKAQASDKAVAAKAGAMATGSAAKDAALDKAADAKAAANGKTSISGAAKADGATPAGDASAGGSAQASRERGAVNARASVQGSARP